MDFLILGAGGMLGGYVSAYLKNRRHNIFTCGRETIDAQNVTKEMLFYRLTPPGAGERVVINCIGMIKPQVDKYGAEAAIKVNSLFPRILADVCQQRGDKLIHITTDCVFSGNPKDVPYTEKSFHDAVDIYGKTKSLGEPENCTVIRTSIIGEEKTTKRSLVEWIKSNANKKVNGYINHCWNGLTCLQLSKVIEEMVENDSFWQGVRHVYTPQALTKYTLVDTINSVYDLNMSVAPVKADVSCDRTMGSVHEPLFKIPSLEKQIKEMKDFKL